MIQTMPDLRKAVLSELTRQGKSKYWLVKELEGKRPKGANVTPMTVYNFLNGKNSLNSDDLGLIFDALGLEVKPKK